MKKLKPGDIYRDCKHHPTYCLETYYDNDSEYDSFIRGMSLWTGVIGFCSPIHCGPVKLSPGQVVFRIQQKEAWLLVEQKFNNDWNPRHYEEILKQEKEFVLKWTAEN